MHHTQHREEFHTFTKIKFSIKLQAAGSTYLQGDSVVCEDTEDESLHTLHLTAPKIREKEAQHSLERNILKKIH